MNLTILGILFLVAFVAAFFGTDFLVLRQVKRLLHVTRDVAEGNLGVRTGPPYAGDELGELARAFDKMSGALEHREIEQEETSRQILRQSALLDAVNQVLQKTFTADTVKEGGREVPFGGTGTDRKPNGLCWRSQRSGTVLHDLAVRSGRLGGEHCRA